MGQEESYEVTTPTTCAPTCAPTTCPECGTSDISAGCMEQSEHEAWCEVECENCSYTWKEIYTFDRIE